MQADTAGPGNEQQELGLGIHFTMTVMLEGRALKTCVKLVSYSGDTFIGLIIESFSCTRNSTSY